MENKRLRDNIYLLYHRSTKNYGGDKQRGGKMELTVKQKRFCEEYVKAGNATQSAIKAGYSKKTASVIGVENLSKPKIASYIKELTVDDDNKRIADGKEILEFLTKVMRGEEKDAFELDLGISDRINAGKELAKRIIDTQKGSNTTIDKLDKVLDKIEGVI